MIKKLQYLQASNILQIEIELKKSHTKILRINVYFWETAYLPLPKPNINTYFLLWAKCQVWGGVGGQNIKQYLSNRWLFFMFTQPHLKVRGVRRIGDSYANLRLTVEALHNFLVERLFHLRQKFHNTRSIHLWQFMRLGKCFSCQIYFQTAFLCMLHV